MANDFGFLLQDCESNKENLEIQVEELESSLQEYMNENTQLKETQLNKEEIDILIDLIDEKGYVIGSSKLYNIREKLWSNLNYV